LIVLKNAQKISMYLLEHSDFRTRGTFHQLL